MVHSALFFPLSIAEQAPLSSLLPVAHNTGPPPLPGHFNSSLLRDREPDGDGTIDPSLLDAGLFPQITHPATLVSGREPLKRRRVPPGMVRTAANSCSSYITPTSELHPVEREVAITEGDTPVPNLYRSQLWDELSAQTTDQPSTEHPAASLAETASAMTESFVIADNGPFRFGVDALENQAFIAESADFYTLATNFLRSIPGKYLPFTDPRPNCRSSQY